MKTNNRPAKPEWHRVIFLSIFLVSLPAFGADLLAIYRLAEGNDPTFEAARRTFEAAQQKMPEARAGLLPTVNLNAEATRTNAITTFAPSPPINRDVNAWSWTLQLTQPLVRVQNAFAYQESEHIVEEAGANFANAEQDLILRVTQAYFDVVVAQENISVAEAQVKAMEEQLGQATHGYRAGTNAITDVYEAKARRDLATAQKVAALNELANKRADLEKIVGPVELPLAALLPEVTIPNPQPSDVNPWADQARNNNPSVLAQVAALAAAASEVNRNRAEHLPTLDLTAAYGSNYSSGSLTWPTDYTTAARTQQVGFQLNIPIYSGGATSARTKEAIAIKFKTEADLDAARRQAVAEAHQAYDGVNSGLAQVEALKSALDSSESAVKGNQEGFKVGFRANIDVLNAQQQRYAAQRDLEKARYDTIMQGLKLKAAAGILAEHDVEVINAWMNREKRH